MHEGSREERQINPVGGTLVSVIIYVYYTFLYSERLQLNFVFSFSYEIELCIYCERCTEKVLEGM